MIYSTLGALDLQRFTGLLGVLAILVAAFLFSTARRSIHWRPIIVGIALQAAIAILVLRVPVIEAVFKSLASVVVKIISFANDGASFMFGPVGPGDGSIGFIFAFQVLPIIIFFAALMRILYHLGIMQVVIAVFAALLRRALGVTGLEALTASTNVFVGQTEAPLAIKPYLSIMTRSQLMVVMTTGFATAAGSVMLIYVNTLGASDTAAQQLFAKHILTASIMSAPGAFVIAKLLLPETEDAPDESLSALNTTKKSANILDAATTGTTEGLKLALNVGAMLIAFIALIALIDWPLNAFTNTKLGSAFADMIGVEILSFETILGTILAPIAWLIGVASEDAREVGSLLGTQIFATEIIAYGKLGEFRANDAISLRSQQIATYALCGFCNLASIGIQLGAFSAMAPDRQADFSKLVMRAMVAGAMACWMTASIAGLFIG
ncbi:MAG: nucleoside transporter C-terminal domain-containing protein [Planctomycetota bacterium]